MKYPNIGHVCKLLFLGASVVQYGTSKNRNSTIYFVQPLAQLTEAASGALLPALIVGVDAAAAAVVVEVTMAEKHQLPLPAPTASPGRKADGTEATCPCPRCLEDIPGMKESVLKSSADLTKREGS